MVILSPHTRTDIEGSEVGTDEMRTDSHISEQVKQESRWESSDAMNDHADFFV